MKVNISVIGIFYFSFLLNFCLAKEQNVKAIDFNYENDSSTIYHFGKNESEKLDPEEHSDKYFLIRSGLETPTQFARRSKVHFATSIKEEVCQVENLPGQSFISGGNIKFVNERIKFLRQCIKFKVEDPQKKDLEYDSIQKNCEVTKINNYSLLLAGGDCFIKATNSLDLTIYLDPKCKDHSFLVENKISPMELLSELSAYIYPKNDLGPVFIPTKSLWRNKLFINLNAGKELIETIAGEDETEGKRFFRPTRLAFPDIFVYDLKLHNQENSGFFDLGLLISTISSKNFCDSGLCSSYSNYDVPLAPEIILYELSGQNGKRVEVATTPRVGDRFPGQWNGEWQTSEFFHGVPFEKGKKYAMELRFSDPVEDYNRLKRAYSSLLRSGGMGTLRGLRVGVDELGTLSTFSGLDGRLNNVPSLPSGEASMFGGISWNLTDPIPGIITAIKDKTFPPLYTEVCSKDMSKCKKSNSKEIAKIFLEFEVVDIKGNNIILGDNISVERVSDLMPSSKYILNLKNRPTVKCKDL